MSLAVPCERFFFFIFIAKILIEDLFAKIHAYYKNKSSLFSLSVKSSYLRSYQTLHMQTMLQIITSLSILRRNDDHHHFYDK